MSCSAGVQTSRKAAIRVLARRYNGRQRLCAGELSAGGGPRAERARAPARAKQHALAHRVPRAAAGAGARQLCAARHVGAHAVS